MLGEAHDFQLVLVFASLTRHQQMAHRLLEKRDIQIDFIASNKRFFYF